MNKMPGFTAVASLHPMSESYRLTADHQSSVENGAAIIPQGCGFWKWLECAGAVAACIASGDPVLCITTTAPACLPCL